MLSFIDDDDDNDDDNDDATFMFPIEPEIEELGYFFSNTEIDANDDIETGALDEDLLCCDMVTGKVVHTGRSVIRRNRNCRIFYYHSSMLALPPILK